MIWYVDIEHEKVLADPKRAPDHFRVRDQRAGVMSDIAGVQCEAIHYTMATKALAQEKDVRAIAISGNVSDWEEYDLASFQPFFELVMDSRIPCIGLCGGHQLIALMYGAECGPLRKLETNEEDPGGGFAPGYFKEVGYKPVRIVQDDPLFEGLDKEPIFFESHYWEVKQLPPDFCLLASTAACGVQVMKHRRFTVYGTQFHPEVHSLDHRDGRVLLANFYKIAGASPEREEDARVWSLELSPQNS
jgi:GMP synthase (glutamine-hydrolysing)